MKLFTRVQVFWNTLIKKSISNIHAYMDKHKHMHTSQTCEVWLQQMNNHLIVKHNN